MTACSDPGIVYVKIPSESDNSTMQIARNSSAEEVQSFARPNSSEHLTGNNDAQDETEEHRKSDDGLIGGDVEMGSIGRDDITRNNSSSRTANPSASAAAGTTGTSSSSGGMKNRITVGGAASANRTAHNSTGALSLLGTPAAPYLPPPAMVECGRCQIDRPRDASHCHYCGVCVKNLDHHCPWTGKCIGEKTLRFFFAFLWSLMGLIAFVVAFVVISAVKKYELFSFKQHT